MKNHESLKDRFERKVADAKRSVKRAKEKIYIFWMDNKTEIVQLAPYVVAVAVPTIGLVKKHVANKKTEDLMENHIYDRSAGHYWMLKRQPKQHEWAIIDQRRSNGESYYDILSSMNLLK